MCLLSVLPYICPVGMPNHLIVSVASVALYRKTRLLILDLGRLPPYLPLAMVSHLPCSTIWYPAGRCSKPASSAQCTTWALHHRISFKNRPTIKTDTSIQTGVTSGLPECLWPDVVRNNRPLGSHHADALPTFSALGLFRSTKDLMTVNIGSGVIVYIFMFLSPVDR